MPITVLKTADGKLDSADIIALSKLEERLSSGSPKVVLYLHGGLVSQDSAEAMVLRLSSPGAESLNVPNDWEQIYVVWRTGLVETLKHNWIDLFTNDRLYRTLFKRLISYVSDKLSDGAVEGRAATSSGRLADDEIERRMAIGAFAPFSDLDEKSDRGKAENIRAHAVSPVSDSDVESELGRELSRSADMQKLSIDLDAALADETDHPSRGNFKGNVTDGRAILSRLDKRVIDDWATPSADGTARAFSLGGTLAGIVTGGIRIGKRVLGRMRSGRDHGVHATIAEEIAREFYGDLIGSAIWGMMVKDAGDHFLSTRLGSRLIEILDANPKIRLLVVGHSAGSIWATELLAARYREGMSPLDLILLAPAVRITKFAEMLEKASDSIGKFRLFAMKDDLERADALIDGFACIYPSSLLYLVSGLFECRNSEAYLDAPLLGMDRFIGSHAIKLDEDDDLDAIASVKAFLKASDNRVVFSISAAGDGLNSSARKHGGFDNDVATLASVATYFK